MSDIEEKAKEENEEEEEFSLEDSFEKLDKLLERLEDREIPLEEAFALYQQGMTLMKQCSDKIDTVEKKILMMNGDGSLGEL